MPESVQGGMPIKTVNPPQYDERRDVDSKDDSLTVFDVPKDEKKEKEPSFWSSAYNFLENHVIKPIKQVFGIEESEAVETLPVVETSPSIEETEEKPIEEPAKLEAENLTEEDKMRYSFDFELTLTDEQQRNLDKFKAKYKDNESRYKEVAAATGVAPELIAALHWRESEGDFDTYLHNGDPLGEYTENEPSGIYFEKWEDAAIDALKRQDINMLREYDERTFLKYAEDFNGWGYRDNGYTNPYLYAGTSYYESGKYDYDGHYNSEMIDSQLGVAVMLQALKEQE